MTNPGAGVCYQHPNVEAEYECKGCGKMICKVCAFPYDMGRGYQCPECASAHLAQEEKQSSPATAEKPEPGAACSHHPNVPAAYLCDKCKTPVCATCVFTFPGNRHICPKCAENNETVISPQRKKSVIWSFVCAAGGMVLFILFFFLVQLFEYESELEVFSTVYGSLIIIVNVIGMAVGFGAMDKRLGNTMSMWIATIWNLVILGAFILLCLVGLFIG